jgi:lysyl-tRNA synthetase class 2
MPNAPANSSAGAGPADLVSILALRTRINRSIRTFFLDRGYLEAETPVRVSSPALELHIDAEPSGACFLRTSPELHMKRLLAAGCRRIFQLGPCFRRGEHGDLHHPEYTMLEWYRTGTDYEGILDETRDLLLFVAQNTSGSRVLDYHGRRIDLESPWPSFTVAERFRTCAGWDPTRDYDPDRFDLDLVNAVEPSLPQDRPAVLTDYPAEAAALARLKPGHPAVAERWELYVGGLELANAYSELTDPVEQRQRFEACARRRKALDRPVYPLDQAFLDALERGVPDCAGVALGVDRLVMLLADAASLSDILPFRE